MFTDLTAKHKGAGWAKVHWGNRLIVLPDFELQALLTKKLITTSEQGFVLTESPTTHIEFEERAIEVKAKSSGTMILGMGASGIYEMYKREALALLMQGMDVMLFNYRGQGESTGTPSEVGTYEDMEAVYQYLKQTHQVSDEQIVVKGLCLSGGTAAHLAANHPNINLILDQTYAEISDISLNTVMDTVKDILHYKPEEKSQAKDIVLGALTPIMRGLVALASPNYSVSKHLNKVKGKILVLRASEDTYTDKQMTDKLLSSYAKKTSYEMMRSQMRVGHMSGIHGTWWLDAKNTLTPQDSAGLGRYHVFSFLKEAGVLDSFVDKGTILTAATKDYQAYENKLSETLKFLTNAIQEQPTQPSPIPKEASVADLKDMKQLATAQALEQSPVDGLTDGKYHYKNVLEALNRLKDKLGGAPTFGHKHPTINTEEHTQSFMGVPMANVKDWFTMVLKNKWKPSFFWKGAARIFGVSKAHFLSPYEEAHLRIQRFGLLIANKDKILQLLKSGNTQRYHEFGSITGMAWHPEKNSPAVEKLYFEFVEQFLTTHFEAAKNKGDEALIEYFKAFDGVCFEDRARILETYVLNHPLEGNDLSEVQNIPDWDTGQPVETAFEKEATALAEALGSTPTPKQLLKHLQEKGVFELEFIKGEGRSQPSLADFHQWALTMIDLYALEPYSTEELLAIEFDIFKQTGISLNYANFMAQLKERAGSNQESFDPTSAETTDLLQKYVDAGKLSQN